MPHVIDIQSWADNLELVRLPGLDLAISEEIQARVDALSAHSVRITVAQTDATTAQDDANEAIGRIYQTGLDAQSYTNYKIQQLRDELLGTITSKIEAAEGSLEEVLQEEIEAKIDEAVSAAEATANEIRGNYTEARTALDTLFGLSEDILDEDLPLTRAAAEAAKLAADNAKAVVESIFAGFTYPNAQAGIEASVEAASMAADAKDLAQASATAASNSANSASGHAATAVTKAGEASLSAMAAAASVVRASTGSSKVVPADMADANWTHVLAGAPGTIGMHAEVEPHTGYVTVPDTDTEDILFVTQLGLQWVAGQTYRVTAIVRTDAPTAGVTAVVAQLDEYYDPLSVVYPNSATIGGLGDWELLVFDYTLPQAHPDCIYFRIGIRTIESGFPDIPIDIQAILVEDVTQLLAIERYSEAAVSSAEAAEVFKNTAVSAASAASSHAVTAETYAEDSEDAAGTAAAAALAAASSASSAETSETDAGLAASAASASATAASISAGAAGVAAGNAEDSADAAALSATQAQTARNEAGISASSAQSFATTASVNAGEAVISAGTASSAASAASGFASNAEASKTAAGISASAASGSATTASTAAGTASTSASQAAVSKTTAEGAAVAANASAIVSATAVSEAVIASGATGFELGLTGWSGSPTGGSPLSPETWTVGELRGRGSVLRGPITGTFYSERSFTLIPGRTYQIRTSFVAHTTVGATGSVRVYAGLVRLDSHGETVGSNNGRFWNAASNVNLATSMGWQDLESEPFTLEDLQAADPTVSAIRLAGLLNYESANLNLYAGCDGVWLEDITDLVEVTATVTQTSAALSTTQGALAGFQWIAQAGPGTGAGIEAISISSNGQVTRNSVLLHGDVMAPGTVSVGRLMVMDHGLNKEPDGELQSYDAWTPGGSGQAGWTHQKTTSAVNAKSLGEIRWNKIGANGNAYIDGPVFIVEPGDQLTCSYEVGAINGTIYQASSSICFTAKDGGSVTPVMVGAVVNGTGSSIQSRSTTITVPANMRRAWRRYQVTMGNTEASVRFWSPVVIRATPGATLITPNSITGNLVVANSITSREVDTVSLGAVNAWIGTAAIVNASITAAKILDATITTAKIANASITNAKIANLSVDTLKIAGNAVTVSVSAYTAGLIVPSGSGVVQSLSITSPANSVRDLLVTVNPDSVAASLGDPGGSALNYINVSLYRRIGAGAWTLLRPVSSAYVFQSGPQRYLHPILTFAHKDSASGAGVYEYEVRTNRAVDSRYLGLDLFMK